VTIVEFTDYQCPFCQTFSEDTLPHLMADKIATGEVYYILKDLPLDSIHPNARSAAKAARCAGEQDAYWEMHDALFESQSGWSGQGGLPVEVFIDLAANLDLDRDAFTACLDDMALTQAIQANVDEAREVGADSTPFFFVDGFPIPGAQPYELFEYAIAEAKEGKLADAYVPPEPDLENVFAIGDPDAPVTIVEYTDYQCPYCSRHFEQTFTQIKENYVDSGQVYYIFKDFPLTGIHPQAVKAAEAARCAAEQDAFLAMHDRLFVDQAAWSEDANAAATFKQFAQDQGLDGAAFAECLDSGRQEAAVMAELQEGADMGINGTPAFLINGHSMSGAQPYAIFEQAIEQFLTEAG
jgi:protein-disulfide isomerase